MLFKKYSLVATLFFIYRKISLLGIYCATVIAWDEALLLCASMHALIIGGKKYKLKYRWQFTPHKKLSCGSITTALLLKLLGSLGKDTEKVHFLLTSLYGLRDLYDLCHSSTRTFFLLKCHLSSLSKFSFSSS